MGEFLPSTRALRVGLQPLRAHALELVRDGVVAFEELPRIAALDWLAPRSADAE